MFRYTNESSFMKMETRKELRVITKLGERADPSFYGPLKPHESLFGNKKRQRVSMRIKSTRNNFPVYDDFLDHEECLPV